MARSDLALPQPQVFVMLEVWQEIMHLTRKCSQEIAGFGWVERVGNDFVVYEHVRLPQTVTAAHAHIDKQTLGRYLTDVLMAGRSTAGLRFQWHSHVNGEAYASYVDVADIEADEGKYFITLVVNKRGQRYCRVNLMRIDVGSEEPLQVAYETDIIILAPALPDEVRTELDEFVATQVKTEVPRLLGKSRQKPVPVESAVDGRVAVSPDDLLLLEGGEA